MLGVSSFPLFRPIIDKVCLSRIRHLLNLQLKGAINPEGLADREVCSNWNRPDTWAVQCDQTRGEHILFWGYSCIQPCIRGDRSTFKYPLCKLHRSITASNSQFPKDGMFYLDLAILLFWVPIKSADDPKTCIILKYNCITCGTLYIFV